MIAAEYKADVGVPLSCVKDKLAGGRLEDGGAGGGFDGAIRNRVTLGDKGGRNTIPWQSLVLAGHYGPRQFAAEFGLEFGPGGFSLAER